jgi:hypothetical protein
MMMSIIGDDDTSASIASFISAVAEYAHMNSLLISQHQCIRGSFEEFYSWLVSSEDIYSMSDLKIAVADEEYLNKTMKDGNGQSGVEEERLSVFKRAVLDYQEDLSDVLQNIFGFKSVLYGGLGYEFRSISDAPKLIRTIYLLKKQHQTALLISRVHFILSRNSPDWYGPTREEAEGLENDSPPFDIQFVEAGSRIGYRWQTHGCNPCEVNWLDPEPDTASSDYANYREELQVIESEVNMYREFYKPPTEEEYNRLCEEWE